jgi:integrase
MSVRRRKINGRWVYQARVAFQKRRASAIRTTREEARLAESALLAALKAEAGAEKDGGAGAGDDRRPPRRLRREPPAAREGTRDAGGDALGQECHRAQLSRHASVAGESARRCRAVPVQSGARGEGCKASTVNRNLSTLLAAARMVRPGLGAPKGLFRKAPERVRWLAPEEELLVLDVLPLPFRHVAKLAALTLMRLSEIRRLRREQVRLADGLVVLPQTKTDPRLVILSVAAQEILREALASSASEYVFPIGRGDPTAESKSRGFSAGTHGKRGSPIFTSTISATTGRRRRSTRASPRPW